jgi:hypothetical protein
VAGMAFALLKRKLLMRRLGRRRAGIEPGPLPQEPVQKPRVRMIGPFGRMR